MHGIYIKDTYLHVSIFLFDIMALKEFVVLSQTTSGAAYSMFNILFAYNKIVIADPYAGLFECLIFTKRRIYS